LIPGNTTIYINDKMVIVPVTQYPKNYKLRLLSILVTSLTLSGLHKLNAPCKSGVFYLWSCFQNASLDFGVSLVANTSSHSRSADSAGHCSVVPTNPQRRIRVSILPTPHPGNYVHDRESWVPAFLSGRRRLPMVCHSRWSQRQGHPGLPPIRDASPEGNAPLP